MTNKRHKNETDFVSFLAEKFKNISAFKANKIFEDLQNQSDFNKSKEIKILRLEEDVELDLLKCMKSNQDGLYDSRDIPLVESREDKVRLVSKFDVLFKLLLKIGFNASDVCKSFLVTRSLEIEDHFDWLLINVNDEKIPYKFFDKYCDFFTEETFYMQNNQHKASSFEERNSSRLNIDSHEDDKPLKAVRQETSSNRFEPDAHMFDHKDMLCCDPELKENIIQFVEKHKKNKNKTKDIHKQYATMKRKLMLLEKTNSSYDNDQQTSKAMNIEKLKYLIRSIQVDPSFNQAMADVACREKLKSIAKERGVAATKKQKVNHLKVSETIDFSDWNIVEFDSKIVNRMKPKDVLFEYCKKNNLGIPILKTTQIGSSVWRSTIRVEQSSSLNGIHTYELPLKMGASTSEDAKQLISMHTLFAFDSKTSMYKVFPQCHKDLWISWANKKSSIEMSPIFESDRKRIQFLIDLIGGSYPLESMDKKAKFNGKQPRRYTTRSQELSKKNTLFQKMKRKFSKRCHTEDYMKIKYQRYDLPVSCYRDEILRLVNENNFVVISGETGSGKSTQIPQYLAEDLLLNSATYGSVICTQPRRISAVSIAQRVSYEMCDIMDPESIVGYNVRFLDKTSMENVLIYCTTGILLRKLENDRFLHGVTHIVVDEIHERTVESDFLLLVLKRLCAERNDFKLIVMSATAETSKFSEYLNNCPILHISGRTYPVKEYFLEDIISMTGYTINQNSQYALKELPTNSRQSEHLLSTQLSAEESSGSRTNPTVWDIIEKMDLKKINYDLIITLLLSLHSVRMSSSHYSMNGSRDEMNGSILIFVPGLNEIRKLLGFLSQHSLFGDNKKYVLIPLHSSISAENQEKAFSIFEPSITKIIISTNIAETGVTISDVTVVIDTGMANILSYDKQTQLSQLERKCVAQSNVLQRRGRAGRMREGVSYHLFTREHFENMEPFEAPEIFRLPLEEMCLRIKICGMGFIKSVLEEMIDRPNDEMVSTSIARLVDVQAFTKKEQLTPLGAHLANLPVNVHLGKMIIFGAIFQCLDPILTIAATLSHKTPFVRPLGEEDEADIAHMQFKAYNSDFLTTYKAYCIWRENYLNWKEGSNYSRNFIKKQMKAFCKKNYLSYHHFEVIEDIKKEYLGYLTSIGFVKQFDRQNQVDFDNSNFHFCETPASYNRYSDSIQIINAAIVAGLYPKIAQVTSKNEVFNQKFELQASFASVLHGKELRWLTDFAMYNNAFVSTYASQDRVIMWDVSCLDTIGVALFSESFQIHHKLAKLVIDEWIVLDCPTRTCILLKLLRKKLNNCLAEKMKKPGLDLNEYNQELMSLIVDLFENSTSV